ncbi:MAG TPA: gamma-glutamyltransferase, partial [Longilinea sp.]|nr:gamma-glutamyltransferase [Longilinea sp.]
LYYLAAEKRVYALNGSGRAPQGLSLERLKKEGLDKGLPPYHPYTVTVPGACAGWCDMIERFGRLPLTETLAPAIRLAEEGFPVAPITAYFWQRGAERQLRKAVNGLELTLNGWGPSAGEIFHNPGLGRSLRLIAEGGKNAYYNGPIAEAIVSILTEAGGCMSAADLAAHHSTWEEPISNVYRDMRVWECPPNGQGLAALLALNILNGFDLSEYSPLSVERYHLEIEAMRLAFADVRWYVADPVFSPAPLEQLLSEDYAQTRRRLIDPLKANPAPQRGSFNMGNDTVYFSVVDGEGNACSFINSNYMGFGTGIVPRGWGFSLQNRGHNFSLDPLHPNALAPGKRPYHTIIPAMATRAEDNSLYASFGVMGGFMQPQGHVQVLTALLDDDLDPQAALDRPRFCLDVDDPAGTVALEEGIPSVTINALQARGHKLRLVSGWERALFGRGQVILRDLQTGALWGGSDGRADGCAFPL